MIVQPAKLNMNKTTLLVLSRNSTRRTWRRQWSEWVWWRWNGGRTERTSATFTTSRTTSSSNTAGPELNLQQAASLLRKLFTSDKTRTVSSPPGMMITACCCCLCSLLTVLLAAIGSSGTATDHRDPVQLLWFLMHGPKINNLLIRKAERLRRWALQSREWEDWQKFSMKKMKNGSLGQRATRSDKRSTIWNET